MADPTLPPELGAECAAAHRKLLIDLGGKLPQIIEMTRLGWNHDDVIRLLEDLIGGRFRQIAITSYQAGLAQAGAAAQAVDDLAALRRAFRILRER